MCSPGSPLATYTASQSVQWSSHTPSYVAAVVVTLKIAACAGVAPTTSMPATRATTMGAPRMRLSSSSYQQLTFRFLPGPPRHRSSTWPAVEQVVAGGPDEHVPAGAAEQLVVARATTDAVGASARLDPVAPPLARMPSASCEPRSSSPCIGSHDVDHRGAAALELIGAGVAGAGPRYAALVGSPAGDLAGRAVSDRER